jgi:hypothetical protein
MFLRTFGSRRPPTLLLNIYELFMIHDKIILSIVTWSVTRENSAITRVEWDALGQLIRKVSEGLP